MSDGTRSFVYDANSNLTTMKVLNGSATAVEEDFSYDGGNRPVGLTDKVGPSGTALHTYSFTYDGRGNASKIVSDSSTTTYTYDNANQLLSATTGSAVTSYAYDANHNRTKMTTSAGTTTYSYDSSDTELTSTTDPNGKVTTYQYDASGNLSTATFDASGANQQTTYHYNTKNLLSEIDQPDGGTVSFTYDADGNRLRKTVVSGGPVPTQTMVKDVYQAGRIAYETDGAGTTLATFSYDPNGAPESVVVGSDPNTGTRYYYVYNTHGDVVALVDKDGNIAARYSYDEFGAITDSSETFANGWSNPYRYDGMDRVRYDNGTGLYWMSVRAYDPALGRFISRDPEGRTPLMFATQPYAYAGNNPLRNIDPSGQRYFNLSNPEQQAAPFGAPHTPHHSTGTTTTPGKPLVYVDPCPDSCKRQTDMALIKGMLEHQRLVNNLVGGISTLASNALAIVVDVGVWGATHDPAALFGGLADAATFGATLLEVIKYWSDLTGSTDIGVISSVAGFVQAIAGALHIIATGAAIFSLFDAFGDLLQQGIRWLKVWAEKKIKEFLIQALAHLTAGITLIGLGANDEIDAQEALLPKASLQQLQQMCQSMGVLGCQ